jgi:hypothetical protein
MYVKTGAIFCHMYFHVNKLIYRSLKIHANIIISQYLRWHRHLSSRNIPLRLATCYRVWTHGRGASLVPHDEM